MSGPPLFTLVIFYFHAGRQHNIDDVCVEFCFILELIYSSDFHEGRQYFMLMLVLNFASYRNNFLNLTINMQLLYFITTVTSQVHSARHHQRAGYSALPSV